MSTKTWREKVLERWDNDETSNFTTSSNSETSLIREIKNIRNESLSTKTFSWREDFLEDQEAILGIGLFIIIIFVLILNRKRISVLSIVFDWTLSIILIMIWLKFSIDFFQHDLYGEFLRFIIIWIPSLCIWLLFLFRKKSTIKKKINDSFIIVKIRKKLLEIEKQKQLDLESIEALKKDIK